MYGSATVELAMNFEPHICDFQGYCGQRVWFHAYIAFRMHPSRCHGLWYHLPIAVLWTHHDTKDSSWYHGSIKGSRTRHSSDLSRCHHKVMGPSWYHHDAVNTIVVNLDEKVRGPIPFQFIRSPILPFSPPLKRGSGSNTPGKLCGFYFVVGEF